MKKRQSSSKNSPKLLNEKIIHQLNVGIVTLDEDGIVEFANDTLKEFFCLNPKTIVGKSILTLKSSSDSYVRKLKEVFMRIRTVRKPVTSFFQRTDVDGRGLYIEVCAKFVKDTGHQQILITATQLNKEQEIQAEALESEKMKALQLFIAGTTQEIQQPIKGIYEHIDTLIKKYRGRDFEYIGFKEYTDILDKLEAMRDRLKYCFDTTSRLLELNKRKVGLKDRYSHLNAVLKESTSMIKHNLDVSDINLKIKASKKLPPVAIGPLELNQIFINVVTNAIQAMPSKGNIVVSTSYRKANNEVVFECKDDGVGISKEALQRVFEPFYTTKQRGLDKNSGLGLSIVYSIVKAYKGDISIKSDIRKGTLVKISFPVYKKKTNS